MEFLEIAARRFCHNLARKIAVKAVDHDAVHMQRRAYLSGGLFQQGVEVGQLFEALHGRAQEAKLAADIALLVPLDLDDRIGAGAMEGAIEQCAVAAQVQPEQAFDLVIVDETAHRAAQLIDCRAGKHIGEPAADLDLPVEPEHLFQVRRSLGDQPIGVDRDQRAETLDASELVDRLPIAIGQIDLVVGSAHAASFSSDRASTSRNTVKASVAPSIIWSCSNLSNSPASTGRRVRK